MNRWYFPVFLGVLPQAAVDLAFGQTQSDTETRNTLLGASG
jgi:hypothetical protein